MIPLAWRYPSIPAHMLDLFNVTKAALWKTSIPRPPALPLLKDLLIVVQLTHIL